MDSLSILEMWDAWSAKYFRQDELTPFLIRIFPDSSELLELFGGCHEKSVFWIEAQPIPNLEITAHETKENSYICQLYYCA